MLHQQLREIIENYGFLIRRVKLTETNGFSIQDAIIQKKDLNFKQDPVGLETYLINRWKDKDYSICENLLTSLPENRFLKFLVECPGTSVDIEKLFSKLTRLLSNGRNFKDSNVIKYLSKLDIKN